MKNFEAEIVILLRISDPQSGFRDSCKTSKAHSLIEITEIYEWTKRRTYMRDNGTGKTTIPHYRYGDPLYL